MTGQAAYALKALQAIVVGVRFSARSVRETIFTPQVERSILVDSERREKMHGSQRSKKGRGTGIEEEMTTNKFGNHREKERERQRQRQIQRQRASENEIFILGESLVGKCDDENEKNRFWLVNGKESKKKLVFDTKRGTPFCIHHENGFDPSTIKDWLLNKSYADKNLCPEGCRGDDDDDDGDDY